PHLQPSRRPRPPPFGASRGRLIWPSGWSGARTEPPPPTNALHGDGRSAVKKLLVLVVAVGALVLPALAAAHPLGNFTINRYSRIQPSGDRVFVLYVLDMAEIPTFQAKARVGREGAGAYARALAADIARRLRLSADGSPLPLRVVRHVLAFPPGQAGLRTTRLEVLLSSPALAGAALHRLAYRDGNFPDRIGWKEIVVSEGAGADL